MISVVDGLLLLRLSPPLPLFGPDVPSLDVASPLHPKEAKSETEKIRLRMRMRFMV